jgi:hypothetical protein
MFPLTKTNLTSIFEGGKGDVKAEFKVQSFLEA